MMAGRGVFRILIVLPALCLWIALTTKSASADVSIYVAGSGNEFGTLDLNTGAFTKLGMLSLPSDDFMNGMGFGSDGNLYGVDSMVSGAHLYRINATNGALTDLGGISHSAIDATTDASGKMYALSRDSNAVFYTLIPPSTTTSVVGNTNITSAGLMAVNAAGTQVFTSVSNGGNSYDLYSIDPTTAAASLIGNTGFSVVNGLFVSGTLYGFDNVSDAIVTLNTSTGAGTKVGTYNLGGDSILASAVPAVEISPVPEPSGLVVILLAASLFSLGFVGRNRHN